MALLDIFAPVTRPAYTHVSLREMLAVWHQRRALARLDAAQLADLGLSRADAQAEAQRPLWDVPTTWRC